MRYAKMLGLLAIAAAALMAFAGVASATTLTSPANTTYTGVIHAVSEGPTTLHNSSLGIAISCEASTMEATVASHGTNITVSGKVSKLTFSGCGTNDVTIVNAGELVVHTDANDPAGTSGNGTLTSTGAEITLNSTSIGISCLYKTNATDIGTITGSKARAGSTATLDINSATVPRTGDSVFCGSSALWTGSYTLDKPDYLDID